MQARFEAQLTHFVSPPPPRSQSAIGFELWSMSGDILFDNILIADNEELAEEWAAEGYNVKRDKIQTEAVSVLCFFFLCSCCTCSCVSVRLGRFVFE